MELNHSPCDVVAVDCLLDYKVNPSPTPTQKGKGQKPESNRKLEKKTSKSGGKGWKKLERQAKVGIEELPHKPNNREDVSSAMGHIMQGTAQRRRSSVQSWLKMGKVAGQRHP